METIIFGAGLFDIDTLKDIDVRITGIHVDVMNNMVTVIRERGMDVKRITLSMEHAEEIGFINVKALKDYV